MNNENKELLQDFRQCRGVLWAIGDETRQTIMYTLIDKAGDIGLRVGEIARGTHLSRPAVSHHIKVLKDAHIINVRKVGTRNYYYLEPDGGDLKLLGRLLGHMERLLTNAAPQPSENPQGEESL